MNLRRSLFSILIAVSACGLALAFAPSATAQEGAGGARGAQKPKPPELRIFALKHLNGEEASDVLSDLFGRSGIRLTTDHRSNSILASGTREQLLEIEAVLERLDRPEQTNSRTYRVINLSETPGRMLEKSLDVAMAELGVNVIVDREHNRIVASGSQRGLDKLAQLIQTLDQRMRPAKPATLRVVWLMESAGVKGEQPMPADLRKVTAPLQKMGIDDLIVETQLMVNVGEDESDFRVSGRCNTAKVSVSGRRIGADAGPAKLALTIEAEDFKRNTSLAEVEAVVSLGSGQFAVLGVSPVGQRDSVFVVQIIE